MTETSTDPIYVAARSVLLDALGALGDYRAAVVIVGATPVCRWHPSPATVTLPWTPAHSLAAESPLLGEVMAAAGFALRINIHGGIDPGAWMKTTTVGAVEFSVPVDRIIPLGAQPRARPGVLVSGRTEKPQRCRPAASRPPWSTGRSSRCRVSRTG